MPPTPHTVLPGTAQSGTAQSGVSRHCDRRPSPARHTPPCGGGSSCQRRPIQCHPAPRSPPPRSTQSLWRWVVESSTPHTVSPGTAQSGTAQPGVSRHCDRRPSPARRTPPCCGGSSSRRRPIQFHPAPRSPAPRSTQSLWRWVVVSTTPHNVLPGATLFGVSRHCGWRPSPAHHTPPCGGGSSSRRRPLPCCPSPRCLASAHAVRTRCPASTHRCCIA